MSDLSGTILDGKYELNRLLGEGGMGTVYEATHTLIGRRLAVKFLHPQYVTSEEVVTRFQREAQAAAAIGHENIIEVTDMGTTEDGAPYIVMEYLNGRDVRQLIADEVVVSPTRTAHIMVQALSALQAAHEAGIIHRDLKPENIYLIDKSSKPDYVKLLDFGISKFRALEGEGSKGLTQTGTVLGTPYYMSPEQARGDQNLSNRSDIYAMGVMLYQMLTGVLPFDAPNYNALLIKILTEDPPPPEQINPDLPEDLVDTIKIAMARDPADRFEDCLEFRERLLPHLPGASGIHMQTSLSPASRRAVRAASSAAPTETPLETVGPGFEKSKSKLPVIIGAVAAAVAVVVGAVFMLTGGDKKEKQVVVSAAVAPIAAEPKGEQKEPANGSGTAKVMVKINAVPAAATIKVDGAIVQGNPFEGPFLKDEILHRVDISAPGYKTHSVQVYFEKEKELSYVLEKEDQKEPESHSKSSRRSRGKSSNRIRVEKVGDSNAEASSSGSKSPAQKKKPRRKIDDEDPWN